MLTVASATLRLAFIEATIFKFESRNTKRIAVEFRRPRQRRRLQTLNVPQLPQSRAIATKATTATTAAISTAASTSGGYNKFNNLSANQRILLHHFSTSSSSASPRKMSTAAVGNYKLIEIEGDLFSAPATHALAHCVGADLAMGAGIAVKFKQIYGKVDELRAQRAQSGGVAVLKDKERFIYYLITKPQSWGSPTYESLRSSLTAMRDHMRSNNVHKLAIPRIGCGIDGLEWDKVSNELQNVFGDDEVEIVVYNFVPK